MPLVYFNLPNKNNSFLKFNLEYTSPKLSIEVTLEQNEF